MTQHMGAEAGQDLVEYALVLPLFLLLIFSVIEFGVLFYQNGMIANAAREGARAGAVIATTGCDDSCVLGKVRTAAQHQTQGLDPSGLKIDVTFPASSGTKYVRVGIQYRAGFFTNMLARFTGQKSFVISSVATMMRE